MYCRIGSVKLVGGGEDGSNLLSSKEGLKEGISLWFFCFVLIIITIIYLQNKIYITNNTGYLCHQYHTE